MLFAFGFAAVIGFITPSQKPAPLAHDFGPHSVAIERIQVAFSNIEPRRQQAPPAVVVEQVSPAMASVPATWRAPIKFAKPRLDICADHHMRRENYMREHHHYWRCKR
jgi:hypothetical protein